MNPNSSIRSYYLSYSLPYLVCCAPSLLQFFYSLHDFKFGATVFSLSTSNSSSFVFEFFKLLGKLTNLFLSILSTLAVKSIKSLLAVKLDVSAPVASFHSF